MRNAITHEICVTENCWFVFVLVDLREQERATCTLSNAELIFQITLLYDCCIFFLLFCFCSVPTHYHLDININIVAFGLLASLLIIMILPHTKKKNKQNTNYMVLV